MNSKQALEAARKAGYEVDKSTPIQIGKFKDKPMPSAKEMKKMPSLLKQMVKESFRGKNEVKMFISERGNRRIEIVCLDDGETWHTIEGVEPEKNYEGIAFALLNRLAFEISEFNNSKLETKF